MFATQVKPWWERHGRDVTLKTEDGVTAETRCLESACHPDKLTLRWKRLTFAIGGQLSVDPTALALLKTGTVTELCLEDVWYRVTLSTGIVGVDATTTRALTIEECLHYGGPLVIDAEPIPGHMMTPQPGKLSVKEQILGVLKSAPEGLSPKQISERTECTERWVFSTLSALLRAGHVEKRGGTYFIPSSARVCGGEND
jgi:hypothetical protein